MKKKLTALAITAATLTGAQTVAADDLTWVPVVGVQWKNYEFDQSVSLDGFELFEGSLDADIPSLSLGLNVIYGKWFGSFKYEDTMGDPSVDSEDVVFLGNNSVIDREDWAVNVGYNVWKDLNLFAGYMDGETSIDSAATDYSQEYSEDGWFLGASYGWQLFDTGTLTVSAAYADMDGSFSDNDPGDIRIDAEGDSDGYSFSISWSAPLTDTVGYYFDLRTQSYEMDADDKSGNFPGLEVETEEDITSFTAGIQWYL